MACTFVSSDFNCHMKSPTSVAAVGSPTPGSVLREHEECARGRSGAVRKTHVGEGHFSRWLTEDNIYEHNIWRFTPLVQKFNVVYHGALWQNVLWPVWLNQGGVDVLTGLCTRWTSCLHQEGWDASERVEIRILLVMSDLWLYFSILLWHL